MPFVSVMYSFIYQESELKSDKKRNVHESIDPSVKCHIIKNLIIVNFIGSFSFFDFY